jgi:extracellular factor (EF) 3-hydroxypalmitic acid methyl ester biosynthesis protein
MTTEAKINGPAVGESSVSFQNSQGLEVQATLLSMSRFQAVFETYSPTCVLRTSEVLNSFKVVVQSRPVYTGRAIISSLVNTGTLLVCEAKLWDSWRDLEPFFPRLDGKHLRTEFGQFLKQWHKVYSILPEYKTVVADMQAFLADLRLWLDQVELAIRSTPTGDRLAIELELARELGQATTPAIGELFEKFEAITARVEQMSAEQQAAHSAFAKRLLHPLLLCSPFLYRTFRKPLGYAGDYEMVNMICREPLEGSTLFAKILNLWFLRQPPAEAHRNRIEFLVERLTAVTLQAARAGRRARILSVGCGPAFEVQKFLAESAIADQARFTLIDFNEETAQHARSVLDQLRRTHNRNTEIQLVRKSVSQILKEAARRFEQNTQHEYDFVYCAGLFDYLPDYICRRLSNILYAWVAPGGLFLTTNVDRFNPRRLTMDYIMDWHLIYRSGSELTALEPELVKGEGVVQADRTGVNVLYTAIKPEHG